MALGGEGAAVFRHGNHRQGFTRAQHCLLLLTITTFDLGRTIAGDCSYNKAVRMVKSTAESRRLEAASLEIDAILREARNSRKAIKEVLIVGTPGSGKATFMRRMKALYDPYTDKEREDFKPHIYASLIDALRKLFSIVPEDILCPPLLEYRQTIFSSAETSVITQEYVHTMHDWWSADDVRASIPTSDLGKSTLHFLDRIIAIAAADYLPTDIDILLSQVVSPPPLDQQLIRCSDVRWATSLLCVCPRQSLLSTHKWLPTFADISAIVFVLDLGDYDNPANMRIAFDFFHRLCNCPWFRGTDIHLVGNKHDSFSAKLAASSLEEIYSDYADNNDPARAIQFLLGRFENRDTPHRRIYRWAVDLLDENACRLTMAAMMDAFQPRLMMVCGF
ncbi:G-protein alpha subunit [Mycena venus]|uniref:G-protein alpha subunit n=1 Tax=Mycena venus TaxID=2733690 RepID=A0A8H6YQV1_9AGAR|nr:G-protein alpha subunit [Mycena venus]